MIITASEQAVINSSGKQTVVNSASDQPVVISDALANFFGTEEKEMLQSEALKRVLDYIKDNQLEVSISLVYKHMTLDMLNMLVYIVHWPLNVTRQ